MFDLSWVELLFVGALALIVIGPRDMPQLFRAGGRAIARCRRLYSDVVGGMHQLEREVDIASGKGKGHENWRSLMPEEIRNLPADFTPGSMTAEAHQRRRHGIEQARHQQEASPEAATVKHKSDPASDPGHSSQQDERST